MQSAKKNDSLNSATVYGRVDNRDNPMNTSLGTTEDQYAKSSTGTTISVNPVATRPVIDDKIAREMWLRFYCSIVEKGFVWTGDIALFANQQTCGLGGKVATPLVSVVDLTPKLVVVETPAVTTGTGEILSLQSKDSDKVTFAEYKNFAKILKDLNSDEIKKLPENEAALHVMAKLNALLLLSPNISDEVKFSVVKPFEAGFKKDEKVYAEIKKFAELEKILKLYDDKKDGEIVIARSPLLVNDIVNVELKDGKISQNMIDNRLEIQLFDKNATLVEMSDFEVEYKNLPAGIKVETPYSKGLLMVTFTADYTPKQEKIQILIKNKKTGAVVSKELTLVPRITEKTDTLASMTAFEVQEGLK